MGANRLSVLGHCAKFYQCKELLVFAHTLLEKQWGAIVQKTDRIDEQHYRYATNNTGEAKAYIQCSE